MTSQPTSDNLASLLEDSAARHALRPALVCGENTVTYATLDDLARRFATALRDLGVGPGRPVALLLPNIPHFSVAYFGCHRAGSPVVPLNPVLAPDELAWQLLDSGAGTLVVWETLSERVETVVARAPQCRQVIVARADLGDLSAPVGAHNLTALVLGAEPMAGGPATGGHDTAVILYTSGTTGRPKGAELTHANLLSNALTCSTEVLPIGPETVALVALPLFHAFGQTVLHNAVLAVGGSLVLQPRWDPSAAAELARRHRVTLFGGVPAMYVTLLARPPEADGDLSSLRVCVSGGAPLPPALATEFERRVGAPILEGYGLSETSPVVAFRVPGGPGGTGSVGAPLPGVDVRLVDDAGAVVSEPGGVGEIWVRGPNVMKGYRGDAEATAAVLVDGWFRTGDVGTRDGDGALRIVGRSKEMIIRSGYKVYPREVEDVLGAHPAVVEAAVVGVPDERRGEEVVAFVTLAPGAEVSAAELVSHCRDRLAAYKCPRRIEIRESLPHGPTGKVLKRELPAEPLRPSPASTP
ncbi:MAG TPA: long-chain fatty acid--CoA ligase [Acidimicrobiales bacterium]|nr:long-chain fatty acid--CoA ligase [Acidimicrobiales bacterium]